VTHAVAAAAVPDDSRVAAAAPAGTHAAAEELDGSHVAAEAPRAGLAEAAGCVECPGAVAAPVAAAPLADALVVQVSSAEFPADEKAAAVSSAELPEDDYSRAALVAVPADGCSPAVCLDIDEVAAPGPDLADLQKVDVEPVAPDDRCRQEHCGSPEEQADCRERRAEEHYWDDREHCRGRHCWDRHCSDRHCSEHRGVARSGFRERRGVDCSAVPGDCRSAVRDEVLHHDFQVRSVDPDDYRSAVQGEELRRDCPGRSVDPGEELRRDYQEHSVGPGDSPEH
jgi:hypothetical protein